MCKVYGVTLCGNNVGKVSVAKQGLYYLFECKCRIPKETVSRLQVTSGNKKISLGVLTPSENGFELRTKIPVKYFESENMEFTIETKKEEHVASFVPIYPEEPFSYIEQLKEAYLIKQNGRVGIALCKVVK